MAYTEPEWYQICAFWWHLSMLLLWLNMTTRSYCIRNHIVSYSTVIKELRIHSELYCNRNNSKYNHNILNTNHNLGQPQIDHSIDSSSIVSNPATWSFHANVLQSNLKQLYICSPFCLPYVCILPADIQRYSNSHFTGDYDSVAFQGGFKSQNQI